MQKHWSNFIAFFVLFLSNLETLGLSNSTISRDVSNTTKVGKCDSRISKLMLYLQTLPFDFDEKQQANFVKMTNACKDVSKCLGSVGTGTAKELKKIYDFRCEKYDFFSYDLFRCFKYIILDRYAEKYSKCKGVYNFTTNDLVTKRKEWENGKSCVMEIAKERCHNISFDYLKSSYDKFVNILTTKPKEEHCDSLFVETNKYQCNAVRHQMEANWEVMRLNKQFRNDNEMVKNGNDQCGILKQCKYDSCNLLPTSKQLEKCKVFDALTSEFNICFEKHGSPETREFNECKDQKNKKDCIHETMMEKCGNSSVKDFDKYYDWFRNLDLEEFASKFTKEDADQENVELPGNASVNGSDLGLCSPIVEDFVTIMTNNKYIEPNEYYPKAIEICQNTMNCYKSIDSEEARKLTTSYQIACDSFDFSMNALFYCYRKFYQIERCQENHSIENSNFFSWNQTLKRKEFLSKKSYFIDFANTACTPEAKKYFTVKGNYEKFVDVVTTKPEDDDCQSVYSLTESWQCTAETEIYVDAVDLRYDMNGQFAQTALEECRLTNKCVDLGNSTCLSESTSKVLEWCQTVKDKGGYFYACLEKLAKSEQDFSKHSCVPKTVSKKERGEEFLMQFTTDKKCLKEVMLFKCGDESVIRFDEYFDNVVQKSQANQD